MNREQIKNRVVTIIEENILRRPISNKDEEIVLGEEGFGIDSLNFLKLLTELEKELQIKIEDDYWDYNKLHTLEDVVEYLTCRVN